MQEYLNFLFSDDETGECFFVEVYNDFGFEDCLAKAKKIAKENFESPRWIDVYSQEEAELLGYDTYWQKAPHLGAFLLSASLWVAARR